MKKFYSVVKTASLALVVCSSLLLSNSLMAQCGPLVENFNSTGGGTAGFHGTGITYGTTNNNGYLQKLNAAGSQVYTIISPTYKLANTDNSIGLGFDLGGSVLVGAYMVFVDYISTSTGAIVEGNFGGATPNYKNNNTSTICSAIATSALSNFPTGGSYFFRIMLTASTGTGLATDVITFDNFRTNGTLANAPLPVTFMSFTAKKVNIGAQLDWRVASESNISRYQIERSLDGANYSAIASVFNPKNETYTYTDATAPNTVYYRIKSVDNDGQFKYSNIARLVNGASSIVVNAFPQPVVSTLTFQHPVANNVTRLELNGVDGRIVSALRPAVGSTQTLIDMSKLQKGLYVIRFDDGAGNVQTIKVVKQ